MSGEGEEYYFDEYYVDDKEDYMVYETELAVTDSTTGECENSAAQAASGGENVDLYQTLTIEEVLNNLQKEIEKVNEILGLSPEEALLVLRYYNWNMDDNALEKYLNDSKSVNHTLNIADTNDNHLSSALVRSELVVECPICGDDVPRGEAVALLRCKHFFCKNCFVANLQCAVKHNHDLISKRCPRRGCKSLLGLRVFRELLPSEDGRKVQRYFFNECLASHTHMRCCPSESSCDGVIRVTSLRESGPDVTCHMCGLSFCFRCQNTPHAPATCKMMRQWSSLMEENEPSLALILTTTKACPKCDVRVEKNRGCNHMTCTRCNNEYCWVCLGPWSEHTRGYYRCDASRTDDMSKTKEQFFLHCFERWDNHKRSLALEKKSLQDGSQQIQKVLLSCPNAPEFEKTLRVLLETQNVLQDCRTVLMNAYVTLFIGELSGSSFHYRLHQLELRTEETSNLINALPEITDVENIQRHGAQAAHWCNVLRKEGFD